MEPGLILIGLTFAAIIVIALVLSALKYLKKNVHFDRKVIVFLCIIAFLANFTGIIWGSWNDYTNPFELLSFAYYAVVRSIYNLACLFVFRDNYSSMGDLGDNPIFKACYYTVNAAVFVIYGILILMVISWKFTSFIKVWLSSSKKLFVFTSLNEESLNLARSIKKDLKKKKDKGIIIFTTSRLKKNDLSDDLHQKVIQSGFLIFEYDGLPSRKAPPRDLNVNYQTYINMGQKNFLSRIGIPKRHINKGVKIFALHEDPRKNILFTLNEHHTFALEGFEDVLFYFRVPIMQDFPMFQSECYYQRDKEGNYIEIKDDIRYENVKVICQYPLVADQFLAENDVYEFIPRNSIDQNGVTNFTFRMALLGAGDTGEAVLKKTFTAMQTEGLKFESDIFDPKIDKERGTFMFRYRHFIEPAGIKFYPYDVYKEVLDEEVFKSFPDYHLIVVSIGNDAKCVEFANIIIRALFEADSRNLLTHPIRVAVHIRDEKNELFLNRGNEKIDVRAFGNRRDIYSADIIINETLNKRAQMIHYCYTKLYENPDLIHRIETGNNINQELFDYILKIRKETNNKEEIARAWDKASIFDKESSISSAQHLDTKCYIANCKDDVDSFYNYVKDKPVLMENLARAEHLRWNAFYFTNDWGKMEYIENGPRKDKAGKKHICLVSWDELDDVSKKANINFKALDYMYIVLMDPKER